MQATEIMTLVQAEGIPLSKQSLEHVLAATEYVNGAKNLEEQGERVSKAIGVLAMLGTSGMPELTADEQANLRGAIGPPLTEAELESFGTATPESLPDHGLWNNDGVQTVLSKMLEQGKVSQADQAAISRLTENVFQRHWERKKYATLCRLIRR